ncbi:hypothetical protein OHAE_779 [Ochrobactrum soli]|uniref:Uncharacterized protein n=1 Tax=Ochrobactrum soli TaxID=2448455 RepID=A0A2P9HLF8_9HYPH|nr:hypothetical protein OHAE_779 [[Ochrobactrum] soli]
MLATSASGRTEFQIAGCIGVVGGRLVGTAGSCPSTGDVMA